MKALCPNMVRSLRLGIIGDDPPFTGAILAEARAVGINAIDLKSRRPQARDLKAARLAAVLLDPEASGSQFFGDLERVCVELPELSVLVCGGRADMVSRVGDLRLGADDWITKPADPSEVLARVEAAQRSRRPKDPALEEVLLVGDLEIRPAEFDAWAAGFQVGLTLREFELLHFLARSEGKVLERRTIYRGVWGSMMASDDRSVYTYVRRVRVKLRSASPDWDYIHSHPGLGYRFEPRVREWPDTLPARSTRVVSSVP